MSVIWAPRARMAVKASWPGVSRNTTSPRRRVDLVGADVLGDAAGLAGSDVRLADGVEQRRLAMVDVTHDGDDRRARQQILGVVGLSLVDDLFLAEGGRLDLVAELVRDQRRRVVIDALVDVDAHHAERPQLLDDLVALDAHLLGQVGHADGLAHANHALVLGGRGDLGLLRLLAGSGHPLARRPTGSLAGRSGLTPIPSAWTARHEHRCDRDGAAPRRDS